MPSKPNLVCQKIKNILRQTLKRSQAMTQRKTDCTPMYWRLGSTGDIHMHRWPQAMSFIMLGCLLVSTGCGTYRLTGEQSMSRADAVSRIDAYVKSHGEGWGLPMGASDTNFTCVRVLASFPEGDTITSFAQSTTWPYTSIREVGVNWNLESSVACGLLDPSGWSQVEVVFGPQDHLHLQRSACVWDFFPFWMFKSSWHEAHRTAMAFEFMRREAAGRYTGEHVDGKRHGQGTCAWGDGREYNGAWLDDKRNGQGAMTWKNGDTYVGGWIDDKHNGQGAMTWENGDTYVGGWLDDKCNGQGTYTWSNGESYVGAWIDTKRSGQGTMTWSDGRTYTGSWGNDKYNGQGTMTWPNGDIYVGGWIGDTRNGQGTYTWPNGESLVGVWVDGKPNGPCTNTWPDGHQLVGDWHGDGIKVLPNQYSISPLIKGQTGDRMRLPATDGFAPNVVITGLPFRGNIDMFATRFRQESKNVGAVVLAEQKLDQTTVVFECSWPGNGNTRNHVYTKSVLQNSLLYQSTAMATEAQWTKVGPQLKACVDSFAIVKPEHPMESERTAQTEPADTSTVATRVMTSVSSNSIPSPQGKGPADADIARSADAAQIRAFLTAQPNATERARLELRAKRIDILEARLKDDLTLKKLVDPETKALLVDRVNDASKIIGHTPDKLDLGMNAGVMNGKVTRLVVSTWYLIRDDDLAASVNAIAKYPSSAEDTEGGKIVAINTAINTTVSKEDQLPQYVPASTDDRKSLGELVVSLSPVERLSEGQRKIHSGAAMSNEETLKILSAEKEPTTFEPRAKTSDVLTEMKRLLEAGVDPNSVRIVGYVPSSQRTATDGNLEKTSSTVTTDDGMTVKVVRFGNKVTTSGSPGEVVLAGTDGMSLLEYCTANKFEEAADLLRKHGAK